MSVKCEEGCVVYAEANQGIDFGGVTSCMTITCILDDGSKVAGHDGVQKRVKPQIIYAIKGRIKAVKGKRTIKQVKAAGAGSCWTPQMMSQQELCDGMLKSDPSMKDLSQLKLLERLAPSLVSTKTDEFKEILSRDFQVQKNVVTYKNYDFGRIQIAADGDVVTGE